MASPTSSSASLGNFADEVGYRQNYISRHFEAEMGYNLLEYINHQKIETDERRRRKDTNIQALEHAYELPTGPCSALVVLITIRFSSKKGEETC